MLMKKYKIISFLILLVLLLSLAVLGCGNSNRVKPAEGTRIIVKVKEGMAASQIANILEKEGLIDSASSFSSQIKSKKLADSLQAGEYEFVAGMTQAKIIDMLVKGEVRYVTVTIPEGLNVKQIAALFEEKGFAKQQEFLDKAKDYTPYDYMETDDELVEFKAEGFLFPATYQILPETSVDDILALLTKTFDDRLTKEMREKIASENMTIREFVTLASLVEKEAAVDEDRPLIAKAFLKRREIEMPLQSCATIQYILGYPKAELTIADTKLPSPYNTYLHYGLPPGPIASPGELAMQAVAEPSDKEYLYFVVQANGKHIFSETYSEHLAAIERASQ